MSLLNEVCWPAVLDALLASTPELPGDVALGMVYQQPHELLSPRHRLLVTCALAAGPDACTTAAGEPTGRWLHDTARTAHRLLSPVPHRSAFPRFTGWMMVDPKLPSGLTLLGLAAAHAERARRPLIVIAADLGPLILGRTRPRAEVTIGGRPTVATLVELSRSIPDTWCHELAHVLDPVDPRLDTVASEVFADTLGALLVAQQPGSLAELDALIARTETEISQPAPRSATGTHGAPTPTSTSQSADGDELPAPGYDSVIAFSRLDLEAWVPTV